MAKRNSETSGKIPTDIRKLNFEESFRALEEIVDQLEGGQVGLEESIEVYARGMQLKRHCEEKLSSAREQVEKIVTGPDGGVGSEPVEIE